MMDAYSTLVKARAQDRPAGSEYIKELLTDFTELHGDRRFGDDQAIIAGIGRLNGMPVTVISHEKGKDIGERAARNFGMAHPEGYRKALRLMKQAEKFNRPVLCLIDTAGAFCGIGAEERGQGLAIAENMMEMMALKVPVLSLLIGEGGSGGALALAVADQVWMMENSVYSVISPEGCSSILWKTGSKIKEATECLKITPDELLQRGFIEKIIPEYPKSKRLYPHLREELANNFQELARLNPSQLTENRYQRFRKFGEWVEL